MSPALNVESQIDLDVKRPMLENLLNLLNIKDEYVEQAKAHFKVQKEEMKKKKTQPRSPGEIMSNCRWRRQRMTHPWTLSSFTQKTNRCQKQSVSLCAVRNVS